jgi:hypothetical protein
MLLIVKEGEKLAFPRPSSIPGLEADFIEQTEGTY